MEYVISEEALIKFVQSHYLSSDKKMGKDIAKDFLKSKQPVKEIASGKIVQLTCYYEDDRSKDLLSNCDGKNIKIYIEVSK